MLSSLTSLTGGGGMQGGGSSASSSNKGGSNNVNLSKTFGATGGFNTTSSMWLIVAVAVVAVVFLWMKK